MIKLSQERKSQSVAADLAGRRSNRTRSRAAEVVRESMCQMPVEKVLIEKCDEEAIEWRSVRKDYRRNEKCGDVG